MSLRMPADVRGNRPQQMAIFRLIAGVGEDIFTY